MGTEVSHAVPHGPSLIEKIEAKWHKAYKQWFDMEPHQEYPGHNNQEWGRVEGVAAALGILRGTSTKHEMDRLLDQQRERNRE